MRTPAPPRFVDGVTLRRLVTMAEAIECCGEGFRALERGELDNPRRSRLSKGRALLMSAEHRSGSAVVKLISLDTDSFASGRPSMDGVVAWIEAESGAVAALIDAAALTSLRTGAASGLATSLLAREDAGVLAMLGAGGLAADQVAAVRAVRPIHEVRIWSRHTERAAALCAELERAELGSAGGNGRAVGAAPFDTAVRFAVAGSSREAVHGADVVCTATRAADPLFAVEDLTGHAHLNAVGAYNHDMCEIPPGAFAAASVVAVDQVEAALAEAGDVIRALEGGQLERERLVTIAELLGAAPVRHAGCVTIFKSVGVAAQDWALAERAVGHGAARGAAPT